VAAPTAPAVSVVIPTYKRASLATTLDGLARQRTGLSVEVVVVDNDPGGGALEIVERFADRVDAASWQVRHVVEPQSGSAYARNRGIEEARGPVIALLDDDVEPHEDWLDRIVEPIREGRAEATGGRVLLDPTVARPGWFDEDGIGGYLTSFHVDDVEREISDREYLVTANAAFDSDLLRRSGGFDPALGPRGRTQLVGDDVHVVRAVQRLGGRVRYVPDAVVTHELPAARLKPGWLLKRAWWQGRSDWTVNADELGGRKYGGAKVALEWYSGELGQRRREGLSRAPVAFHALCDAARTAGALAGAARLARSKQRGSASG
jgi:glycosyltransferase involved in cell wall biosynthesis